MIFLSSSERFNPSFGVPKDKLIKMEMEEYYSRSDVHNVQNRNPIPLIFKDSEKVPLMRKIRWASVAQG